MYTDKELLNILMMFYNDNKRPPARRDFENNPEYPNYGTYRLRFGSWQKALKLVGLDFESIVKAGFLQNANHKARLAEIMVRDHFKNKPIDLAGDNPVSPCDGICPNGKIYDVKSSKFYILGGRWIFHTINKHKDDIEIYYLLGFNNDWTRLEHAWRIYGEMADGDHFIIGNGDRNGRSIEDMKEYDITDKLLSSVGVNIHV